MRKRIVGGIVMVAALAFTAGCLVACSGGDGAVEPRQAISDAAVAVDDAVAATGYSSVEEATTDIIENKLPAAQSKLEEAGAVVEDVAGRTQDAWDAFTAPREEVTPVAEGE